MEKSVSIVAVDKRHYRKIAQQNWGLTDEQMKGMHVHHRIPISKGGSNDPSNLYVCSPSFHKYIWHDGQEWIDWAQKGAKAAALARRSLRLNNSNWAAKERNHLTQAAKKSHSLHVESQEYLNMQRVKSIRSHTTKRQHWEEEEYNFVWSCYLQGVETGYQIAKKLGVKAWKKYANMLKYATLGLSYEQLLDVDKYLEEINRMQMSPVANVLEHLR